jgi:hypothetical protein
VEEEGKDWGGGGGRGKGWREGSRKIGKEGDRQRAIVDVRSFSPLRMRRWGVVEMGSCRD